jgi:hypothetical protein
MRFRHFYCIAGSAEAWLSSIARKGGSRRVILVPDESTTVFGPLKMYGCGEEVVITADEVQAVWPSV